MKNNRFQSLPIHHIDTSVILEPKGTESGFYCQKYMNLVGYKYRGKFSLVVLGEILLKVQKFGTFVERYDFLDTLFNLIKKRNISFYSVPENENIISKIKEADRRIQRADRTILASAVEDKAAVLVTLDSKLVDNTNLEKEFGIKIKHPKNLI